MAHQRTNEHSSAFGLLYQDVLERIVGMFATPMEYGELNFPAGRVRSDYWAIRLTSHALCRAVSKCLSTQGKSAKTIKYSPASLVETDARFEYAVANVPMFVRSISPSHEYIDRQGTLVRSTGGAFTCQLFERIQLRFFVPCCASIFPRVDPLLIAKMGTSLYEMICRANRIDILNFMVGGCDGPFTAALRVCGCPVSTQAIAAESIPFAARCGVFQAVGTQATHADWLNIASKDNEGRRHGVVAQRHSMLKHNQVIELMHTSLLKIRHLLVHAARHIREAVFRW